MGKRADVPKVNAGSMADIAFLLLIFFLVTTSIETDVGIDRLLPKIEKDTTIATVKQKNILRVLINEEGELLVDGIVVQMHALKQSAIDFLDNGGSPSGEMGHCNYCMGNKSLDSSDNPTKAIISLTSHRKTSYGDYITVQNELVAAYNTLRNREAQRLFKQDYTQLEADFANPNALQLQKEEVKSKIKIIQELFPMKLSELETNN